MPCPMALFERTAGGDGWSVGRAGNSVFLSYREAPSDAVQHWFEAHERAIALHPKGITAVSIFDERAQIPSASTIQEVARRFRAYVPHTVAVVTVFEGSTVAASVKRTVVSMVQSMLASSYPVRTARSLPAACDFVARYAVDDAGLALTQSALLAAFNAMRLTGNSEHRSS